MAKKASKKPDAPIVETYPTEIKAIDDLKLHPRNYRKHPPEQIAHLKQSLKDNKQYRNIIVADDYTILGGHGVYLAAKALGWTHLEVKRLPIDPNSAQALKILAADNEISNLAEVDDRLLTEILKEVNEEDEAGLLGTGFDEQSLAGLVMVSRPQGEIQDFDAAAHWVGMPEYEAGQRALRVTVLFEDEETRMEFGRLFGVEFTAKTDSMWYPPKSGQNDVRSLEFVPQEDDAE